METQVAGLCGNKAAKSIDVDRNALEALIDAGQNPAFTPSFACQHDGTAVWNVRVAVNSRDGVAFDHMTLPYDPNVSDIADHITGIRTAVQLVYGLAAAGAAISTGVVAAGAPPPVALEVPRAIREVAPEPKPRGRPKKAAAVQPADPESSVPPSSPPEEVYPPATSVVRPEPARTAPPLPPKPQPAAKPAPPLELEQEPEPIHPPPVQDEPMDAPERDPHKTIVCWGKRANGKTTLGDLIRGGPTDVEAIRFYASTLMAKLRQQEKRDPTDAERQLIEDSIAILNEREKGA